ncbi:NAD(P)H-hydrate dehydratase [Actinoplanes regularis]|uniref:Bifunctional NAD(P)H-hydrate repair enzyme n=1 Tax=Actinoplanes regularis TaxID=52697 RepID=A0A238XCM4_9ACTN|nr:NAD(P)H-hydrate dehydratase [Actinoplanes regularis]GIE86654.1 bifunctional NAD(P)H-hydrate repair enzyme [Actinoplanes regularis]SNR56430.1 yjeF C-terminal region, hydroxyethylthiazole kinase-related/yjeF N-terminal region [Actinoplanes regularis]
MRQAWRVADVRAAEKTLMATLPEGTLMRRAATGLARRCALLLEATGGVYGARVLLLVGSGDNGGDTLYAGAMLAARGAQVRALLLSPDRVHLAGLAALRQAGGFTTVDLPTRSDLVLDGIVGIGASGGLRPLAAAIVKSIGDLRGRTGQRAVVVAVDVPSGVTVDTGHVPGDAVTADVTVTFGCLKPAHVVGPAAARCGQVELVDIGLGPVLVADPAVRVAEDADIAAWWPRPGAASDKYNRGVVGLATGSARYPGAALLSTAGALAGPTGMVRYAGSAHQEVVRAHPSVVAAPKVADAGRVQAWACGSGLGTTAEARTALRSVLATSVPVLLDADAITLLVGGEYAEDLRRDAPLVLTPHDGEFKRLAGEEPGADRMAGAARLAAWTNAVVLLKGDRTIVATPGGEIWANPTGSPALATAGSGDVLAGLLGSLLAAGLPAVRAAVAAAYVHGLAGRHAALGGPATAPEVAAAVRPVLARLVA